jgi:SulP family sulfate permease
MSVNLHRVSYYFLQPLRLFQTYERRNLQPDLMAGLTVAVILLPQAIAFAIIAELPPEMGLYTAIVGAVVGALWGSSNQIHTGPTNAISLLVLSVLLAIAVPGTPEFIVAAGLIAVMAGVFQLMMGLARLGVLVNFVSHSVVIGFSSGAGILIAIKQLRPLLGLEFTSHSLMETMQGVATHLPEIHWPTFILGVGTMVLIVLLPKLNPKLPGALISMVLASVMVYILGLDNAGVEVIGQLPRSLPPLSDLPLLDLNFISSLSTGALVVGAIGLVETTAIARSIATQTGQRLSSNQEFVGQGLANIAVGLSSGYPGAGSFSRSAVNFKANARTPLSAIFSSLFVLIGMFTLAPLAAYLPRAALAGVLIVTAYGMIDRAEAKRIWRGAQNDAIILAVTFLGTLFLHIELAILLGILLSFAFYIVKTGYPRVYPVAPDKNYKHFVQQSLTQPACPQLGILEISGDLYFGATSQVKEAVQQYLASHPDQRFLLLRMKHINHCDLQGTQVLEDIWQRCRQRGGDLFFMKVQQEVLAFMQSSGFYDRLGAPHFLDEEESISRLFHHVLDPAVCIYECNARIFAECQNLPKAVYPAEIPTYTPALANGVAKVSPHALWQKLQKNTPPLVIDVRESREFKQNHIPHAQSLPLSKLLSNSSGLSQVQDIVLVCRSGKRSIQAAAYLSPHHRGRVQVLQGGMLAWESTGFHHPPKDW